MSFLEEGSVPIHNLRWERYAIARFHGLPPMAAYHEAGYKVGKSQSGPDRLSRKLIITKRILWLNARVAEEAVTSKSVTRTEIIESLRDTRQLAKLGETRDRHGIYKETKVDLAASNRADEILAKMHGFMLDVSRTENFDEELEGKTPDELRDIVLSLMEQLDPNMRKMVMSQMAESESDGQTLQ